MNAAELAESLEGAREGHNYRCRCPVHGGRSLMVRDADRENPLVHCMGGCEFGDVVAALRDQGLWVVSERDREKARERKTERQIAWAKRFYWWWRELAKGNWQPAGQDWTDFRKAEAILSKYDEKPPTDKPLLDNPECWLED